MSATLSLRPSPIAGKWYIGNPKSLAQAVDQYLDQAELPELPGEVIGVIAPHAGHIYSGAVAGYAFAAVRGLKPELVAVVSPVHQSYSYMESILTSGHDAYSTPLGNILIDHKAIKKLDSLLQAEFGMGLKGVTEDMEHSLEIELPFLQRALEGEFKLLPIMVRKQEPKVSQALGKALAKCLQGKKSLLVASTDLSHYEDQATANKLDGEVLRQMEAFSPEGIFEADRNGKGFACGLGAVTAVLWAGRELGADTVKVLHYATSGTVTGDYSSVVGYGAAALLKQKT